MCIFCIYHKYHIIYNVEFLLNLNLNIYFILHITKSPINNVVKNKAYNEYFFSVLTFHTYVILSLPKDLVGITDLLYKKEIEWALEIGKVYVFVLIFIHQLLLAVTEKYFKRQTFDRMPIEWPRLFTLLFIPLLLIKVARELKFV